MKNTTEPGSFYSKALRKMRGSLAANIAKSWFVALAVLLMPTTAFAQVPDDDDAVIPMILGALAPRCGNLTATATTAKVGDTVTLTLPGCTFRPNINPKDYTWGGPGVGGVDASGNPINSRVTPQSVANSNTVTFVIPSAGAAAASYPATYTYRAFAGNGEINSRIQNALITVTRKSITSNTLNAPTSVLTGQLFTLSAQITPTAAAGSISIASTYGASCPNLPINASGIASCQITAPLAVGSATYTATYSGDNNYELNVATAKTVSFTANQPPAVNIGTAPPTAADVGSSVSFSVTITDDLPGSRIDLFIDTGTTAVSSCTNLASGSTCTLTWNVPANQPVGNYTLNARVTDANGQAATVARVITLNPAAKITYYHADPLGSPVLATDAAGNAVWREGYGAFGDRLKKPAAADNVGYTGKQHDNASGLSYFGARWYDPAIGRFMGYDPAGFDEGNPGSFNRYGYGNNNPYKFVDPDGRSPVDWFAKEAPIVVVGNSFGALAAFVEGVMTNNAALTTVAVDGMRENRTGLIEAAMMVGSVSRAGSQGTIAIKDLNPLHSAKTVGNRPDLGKLSDAELLRSVNSPKNKDPIKISTESGKVVDGNSRTLELQRRAADPKSKISPDTKIPYEKHTPDRSSFPSLD